MKDGCPSGNLSAPTQPTQTFKARNSEGITPTCSVSSIIQSEDRLLCLWKSHSVHVSWRTSGKGANTSLGSFHFAGGGSIFLVQASQALAPAGHSSPRPPLLQPWEGCRDPHWPLCPQVRILGTGDGAMLSQQPRWDGRRAHDDWWLLLLVSTFGEKTVLSTTSEASICCTNSLLKYA